MKKTANIFLQLVTILIGIGALAFLLVEPQFEGRAVGLDLLSIYADPFIIYGYIAAIPFFVILYKTFRLLWYVRENTIFSPASSKALQTIQYCALAMIAFVIGGEIWIMLTHGNDDAAGGVFMGVLITVISLIIAAGAKVFEGVTKSDIK